MLFLQMQILRFAILFWQEWLSLNSIEYEKIFRFIPYGTDVPLRCGANRHFYGT